LGLVAAMALRRMLGDDNEGLKNRVERPTIDIFDPTCT
jgi:hypothetical protein